MAAGTPPVTLGAGKILATQTATMGGIELQTEGYMFGIAGAVYDGSDNLAVGDTFIFKQSDAVILKYGSTIYYYLDITNVQGIVLPIAP
jgi:hypothetical protein